MTHTYARRIALATLALPLLLAGCTDGDPVPKLPEASGGTPTPSASETTEPAGPVEPTLPPEAQGKGVKAAEAFVRYYFDTVDYAQATGDTKALRSLGSPDCAACNTGADGIEAIYRQGGTITGGDDTVDRTKVTQTRTIGVDGETYFLAVGLRNTIQTVSGTKDLDGTYPADHVLLRFEVMRTAIGYQISKWYVQ